MGEGLKTAGNVAKKISKGSKFVMYASIAMGVCCVLAIIPSVFLAAPIVINVMATFAIIGLVGALLAVSAKNASDDFHKFANKKSNEESEGVENRGFYK